MKALHSPEDILENPADYGFCTFEEFVKNRERWRGRADDEVTAIDRGDPALGCPQRYYLDAGVSGTVRLECLEDGERISRELGLNFYTDFFVKPQLRKDVTLRRGFYNEVTFVPKRRFCASA